jgi:UDP-glucuronate decarboxylase
MKNEYINNTDILYYKKTILIASGSGFIGSNLCKRLLNEGNKIICLDNLFTGKLDNINTLMNKNNFVFINE